jgi:hypothetical protein
MRDRDGMRAATLPYRRDVLVGDRRDSPRARCPRTSEQHSLSDRERRRSRYPPPLLVLADIRRALEDAVGRRPPLSVGRTHWRSSAQIGHASGGSAPS